MADINEIKTADQIKGDKEDYDPTKKREIIKTVLIIFLAALLVLTFFSNTIMNRSLPEITTERVSSGKLTERIRGSGLVESNQSYGVKVEGNKTVDTIMVKVGKEVAKGDVLFTVGKGESDELTSAEEALAALELEYSKALLTPPTDYTSEDQAIKRAREDLASAIAKRDNAVNNQGSIKSDTEKLKKAQSDLNKYTKLQTKLTSVISAIDNDEYSGAPSDYTGDLLELRNAYLNAEKAYNNAFTIYNSLISTLGEDGEPIASQAEIDSAKADMESTKSDMDSAREAYEDAKYSLRSDCSYELVDAEANIDYYTELVADLQNGSMEAPDIDMLNEDVKQKQRSLEDMITSLNKTKKENDNKNKLDSLDLDAKKKEIEKAKKAVSKLKESDDITEITSEYSGVISAINISPGDMTTPDTELIVIDLSDEGYTVKITVDGEKSTKVKKGTQAEVVNNWSGSIEAVLTDIKNDTTAGSKNRVLVFSVTGDVDSGTYLDLSIPCGSGTYDAIVPKSAVYEDSDGKFVLTVRSKSSPLGNRYYAERVPVEVIVSDEMSSAVSGGLMGSEYVITAASAPIKPNDQVRMQDK